MTKANCTYSSAVLLLNNQSPRIHKLAERNNIQLNKTSKIIAFSFHSFTEEKLAEIKLHINDPLTEGNIKYLKTNIKIPGGINVMDIVDVINDRAAFKKLNKEDEILAGIEMERSIINGIPGYVCLQKPPPKDKQIYAFLLDKSIANNQSFIKHNKDWDRKSQAFYIGQTAIGRENRYNQHKSGINANKYVRDYGVKPFDAANCTELIFKYFKDINIQILTDDLRHYQALYYERKLAEELRKSGNGAYSR
jgi:hypothetical protein